MLLSYKNIDVYFHMKSHYEKINKAHNVVDTWSPRSIRQKLFKFRSLSSLDSNNASKSKIAKSHEHLPNHSANVSKHNCLDPNENGSKINHKHFDARPTTRRNPSDMPVNEAPDPVRQQSKKGLSQGEKKKAARNGANANNKPAAKSQDWGFAKDKQKSQQGRRPSAQSDKKIGDTPGRKGPPSEPKKRRSSAKSATSTKSAVDTTGKAPRNSASERNSLPDTRASRERRASSENDKKSIGGISNKSEQKSISSKTGGPKSKQTAPTKTSDQPSKGIRLPDGDHISQKSAKSNASGNTPKTADAENISQKSKKSDTPSEKSKKSEALSKKSYKGGSQKIQIVKPKATDSDDESETEEQRINDFQKRMSTRRGTHFFAMSPAQLAALVDDEDDDDDHQDVDKSNLSGSFFESDGSEESTPDEQKPTKDVTSISKRLEVVEEPGVKITKETVTVTSKTGAQVPDKTGRPAQAPGKTGPTQAPGKTQPTMAQKSAREHEYLQFLLRITEDIISNDLYTNREMQKVFQSHVGANIDRLDMGRMQSLINEFLGELNITASEEESAPSSTDIRKVMDTLASGCVCKDRKRHELGDITDETDYSISLGRITEHTEPSSSNTAIDEPKGTASGGLFTSCDRQPDTCDKSGLKTKPPEIPKVEEPEPEPEPVPPPAEIDYVMVDGPVYLPKAFVDTHPDLIKQLQKKISDTSSLERKLLAQRNKLLMDNYDLTPEKQPSADDKEKLLLGNLYALKTDQLTQTGPSLTIINKSITLSSDLPSKESMSAELEVSALSEQSAEKQAEESEAPPT